MSHLAYLDSCESQHLCSDDIMSKWDKTVSTFTNKNNTDFFWGFYFNYIPRFRFLYMYCSYKHCLTHAFAM